MPRRRMVVTETREVEVDIPTRFGHDNPKDPAQLDYLPFGSEQHMKMCNLRKVEKDEELALQYEGYTLDDVARYGPLATDRFLMATLQQQVRSFKSVPTVPKEAPVGLAALPDTAPPMWVPDSEDLARRGL